uniref:Uncharacterized protein n=1 Tax=Nelumbo nucifera TaxID=4432 RepID=A0A822Y9Y7_NELNU|nr:TPA_asm: hypothetical protein HUJ06_030685 [Nelumbo nucifera]
MVMTFFNMDGGGRSIRNEDFEEEDVWAVVKDGKEENPKITSPLFLVQHQGAFPLLQE